MAIRRNKRIHEFGWEFERISSDQSELSLDVVYHDTDEYGSTVSILSDDETLLSIPVSFLSEVMAEINLEEERRDPSQRRSIGISRPEPKVAKTPGIIKLPSIKRDSSEEVDIESNEVPRRRDPSLIDESQPPAVSFSKRPARIKPDPETEKEIMQRAGSPQERLAKREKPKNKKASIRRAADDGE